jgi:nicotinamidase-related amidase
MSDTPALEIYEEAGMGRALPRGARPAVLVVDLSCGFTDPAYAAGSDLTAEVEATRRLVDVARDGGTPVIFTTIAFGPGAKDGGLWVQKFPTLAQLQIGDRTEEIDPRLGLRPDEIVIRKKGASAFFGTNLAAILVTQRVDTGVLCGATTSGCIRATAIDLMQHGLPALVPRECVGDRASGPAEANLCDIQAKYADVVPAEDAVAYLAATAASRNGDET